MAVTVLGWSIVTWHGSAMHPSPFHPANTEPGSALAVRVTGVPKGKVAPQELVQLSPGGVMLITVPVPLPANVSVSSWSASNVAVTDCDAFIVTMHDPVPLHAPLHPTNVDVEFGVAVSVTLVPTSKGAAALVQPVPQSIPGGELMTVPAPPPAFITVSTGLFENEAVTSFGPFIVSVHVVDVPVHAPLHPANTAVPDGVAVSVTPVITS